ncbi:MAG TPA: hypothetical protein VKB53_02415 [Gammaproteobacteria bacterium]|nr:hypothetical protein [Gammaproteobacteria bacterium]
MTGEDGGPLKGEFTLQQFLDAHDEMTVRPPFERVGTARDV